MLYIANVIAIPIRAVAISIMWKECTKYMFFVDDVLREYVCFWCHDAGKWCENFPSWQWELLIWQFSCHDAGKPYENFASWQWQRGGDGEEVRGLVVRWEI